MGLKSFLFRHSGAAQQLEKRKAELKESLAEARTENASLKEALKTAKKVVGQPPPRTASLERALADAVIEMKKETAASIIPDYSGLLGRLDLAASEHDIMVLKSEPRYYMSVGASALEVMHSCAPELKAMPPKRILDFGCGYGRVARFLKACWPGADLTICDVDFAGLAFCMAHLGMRGFPVGVDPTKMNLGTGYDLIWVGSVITHLDATLIRQLLEALTAALAPGGRLFFTTHGDHPARMMKEGRTYDLAADVLGRVVSDYKATGFGYEDYPGQPGYGVSLTSETWIKEVVQSIPGLTCFSYVNRGWANHQDVVACIRD